MDPDETATPRAQRKALSAQRGMDSPTANPNAKPVGGNVGITANPNATPGAGRGSRNGGGQWGMQPTSATPRLDAGVQTPRLDSNPRRSTADAVAASNRSGAFGIGAQNLQQRRDLYAEMAKDPAKADTFRGQAAALGVTPGGWEAAVRRLNMGGATAPQAAAPTPAPAAPAPAPAPAPTTDINAIRSSMLGGTPPNAQPAAQPAPVATPPAPSAAPAPTPAAQVQATAPTPEVAPTTQAAPAPTPTPPAVAPTAQRPIAPQLTTPWSPPRPDTRGRGNGAKRAQKTAAKPTTEEERNADLDRRMRNSPAARAMRATWDYMRGGYMNRPAPLSAAPGRS